MVTEATTATHQHVWTATLREEAGERVIDWEVALGSRSIPIRSPIPAAASLPGRGMVATLFVDLERLPEGGLLRIAQQIGPKFGLSAAQALGHIAVGDGVPLAAEGMTISSCCGYVTGDESERDLDEEFARVVAEELVPLAADREHPVALELQQMDAYWLLQCLQLAISHPHLEGLPLAVAIATAEQLQGALCPPGSARERLAMIGWANRS